MGSRKIVVQSCGGIRQSAPSNPLNLFASRFLGIAPNVSSCTNSRHGSSVRRRITSVVCLDHVEDTLADSGLGFPLALEEIINGNGGILEEHGFSTRKKQQHHMKLIEMSERLNLSMPHYARPQLPHT